MPRDSTTLTIPELSLVALVGTSGAGKSSFARAQFGPTEVLSSDHFRALIADDASDQSVSGAAFETLHHVADKRLEFGRLTVIDATHVERSARQQVVELAKRHHALPVAIVLDVPLETCLERVAARDERAVRPAVVRQQRAELDRAHEALEGEGFSRVYVLRGPDAARAATVKRVPMRSDRRELRGPFDLIGDVHGCADELETLLGELGYARDAGGAHRHPEGRTVVFLGDLVDRGPDVARSLAIAMAMVEAGTALCVMGNHEAKLRRWLEGRKVKLSHGLDKSVESLSALPAEGRAAALEFIARLQPHYVLDGGALVVAHAGIPEAMHNRSSGKVRSHCLYGETTGESDDLGLPVRLDWAKRYRGEAAVVYGHTPMARARWRYNTICLDTGCVFGGTLTAMRWPERELVVVPAAEEHYAPVRPLAELPASSGPLALQALREVRSIETRLSEPVAIAPHLAEVATLGLARAAPAERLVYLPPGAPRVETLEAALEAYDAEEVSALVALAAPGQAVAVLLCRDASSARAFGLETRASVLDGWGRERADDALASALAAAADAGGLFERVASPWVALEAYASPAAPAPAPREGERIGTDDVDLESLRQRLGPAPSPRAIERLTLHRAVGVRGRWLAATDRLVSLRRLVAMAAAAPELLETTAALELDLEADGSRAAAQRWLDEERATGVQTVLLAPRVWRAGVTPGIEIGEASAPAKGKPARQRRLARRQHALAFEALARFVEDAPRADVLECILGVLALGAAR